MKALVGALMPKIVVKLTHRDYSAFVVEESAEWRIEPQVGLSGELALWRVPPEAPLSCGRVFQCFAPGRWVSWSREP